MAKDALSLAWLDMRRRRFATAISRLEAKADIYEAQNDYTNASKQLINYVSSLSDKSLAVSKSQERLLKYKDKVSEDVQNEIDSAISDINIAKEQKSKDKKEKEELEQKAKQAQAEADKAKKDAKQAEDDKKKAESEASKAKSEKEKAETEAAKAKSEKEKAESEAKAAKEKSDKATKDQGNTTNSANKSSQNESSNDQSLWDVVKDGMKNTESSVVGDPGDTSDDSINESYNTNNQSNNQNIMSAKAVTDLIRQNKQTYRINTAGSYA